MPVRKRMTLLVEDRIHWARKRHAQLAWDFMKQFRRNEQGTVEQINLREVYSYEKNICNYDCAGFLLFCERLWADR